ncbi:MAG: hypothetical protein WBG86_05305 [Polyangiales bacterium]
MNRQPRGCQTLRLANRTYFVVHTPMRLHLSILLGSTLVLSGCGDSSDTEPDGGMEITGATCADLTTFCDNCDDPDNAADCLASASSMNDATCQAEFPTYQEACFPSSAECEQLQKICGQCADFNDETNCGTIANSRTATAEGCANFDFVRFGTCPEP